MTSFSLNDLTQIQDSFAKDNQDAMSEECRLLEDALPLAMETIEVLKTKPVLTRLGSQSKRDLQVRIARLHLAQAICTTVVNMCRLLYFGSFVNMFSLYRDALEMYAYFWYLGSYPNEIREWQDLAKQKPKSIVEYGKEDYARFQRKVVRKFQKKSAANRFHKDSYGFFSTLGTHTNPHSLSMFLPKEDHEENFGFCSKGEGGNLRSCAHSILHLLMVLLEDLYLEFGRHVPASHTQLRQFAPEFQRGREIVRYIPTYHALPSRYTKLKREFDEYDPTFNDKLNFW